MNKQSLITILLSVLMSMTGSKTFAHDIVAMNDDGKTIYYKWTNNYTELAVSYQGNRHYDFPNEYSGNVVIPSSVVYNGNTYSVTSIDNYAFYYCPRLTSVTIPNSVTSIGDGAFRNCSGLTSITIPNSVTSIGSEAFYGCNGLTSVTIPYSVTSIGGSAFYSTGWYNNQANGLLYLDKWLLGYKGDKPTEELKIVDGTKGIAGSAFYGCSGLTSVTIPNSVTSIGIYAFSECSGLTSVTIPNSVTSIGNNAFSGCSSLTSVKVPVTDYSSFCYNKIISLIMDRLRIPVQLIDYEGKDIKDFVVPNDVTCIGSYAFYNCGGLNSVTIPNSVTSIGECAFSYCNGLTSVTIPNSVTSIGNSAFSGCSSLTSVTIPNSVTSIGWSTFSGSTSLNSVTIPNSVTSIGYYAFSNCTGLTTVIIGSGVLSIGYDAFSNTNLKKTIWLTNTPPSGYSYASGEVNYVSNDQFNISNKVVYKYLSSHFVVDGIRYVPVSPSDRTCDAIDCIYDESAENINIGETVTNKGITLTVLKVNPYTCYQNKYVKDVKLSLSGDIGDYAFYGCSLLETVELGKNVTSIGGSAFSSCSKLKSIVIPDAVTSIGSYAFSDCATMTSAKIGNGVETIDNSTFSGCSSLKEITIGSKVKTINQYAFSGCSALPAITIPQAVTAIEKYVFSGCTKLAKVTIADSESTLTLGSNGSNPIFASCPLDYVYIGRDISYQTSSSYGYSPFYRNTTLREVKITDKETEISENEFYGCTNLQTVTIGDGVTTIGNRAFSSYSSLKYFTFGTQVQNIGQEAFSDCTALVQITSRAKSAPACGSQALEDINKWECKLYVPQGYLSVYQEADQWKDFWFTEEGEYITPLKGDVNSDGKVNQDDLRDLVEYIMGGKPNGVTAESADANGDNKANVADVVALTPLLK